MDNTRYCYMFSVRGFKTNGEYIHTKGRILNKFHDKGLIGIGDPIMFEEISVAFLEEEQADDAIKEIQRWKLECFGKGGVTCRVKNLNEQ